MPTPEKLNFAKKLRHNQTECERRMWAELRGRRFQGLKFRRQVPIGDYIVDFLCPQLKLIVEVDGPTHHGRETYDARRTNYLQTAGYHVWRTKNIDIVEDLVGVLDALFEEVVSVGLLTR